jgi:hypothetical protein
VDVIDTGVDVKEDLNDVEIQMTNRLQRISGQVLDARGQPAKEFWVLLFSQNRDRWTNPTNRYWAAARPQPEGGYRMSTLPPGDYYAIALERLDSSQWADPDFLETVSRDAARFSLREGDTKTLDLKIVPR